MSGRELRGAQREGVLGIFAGISAEAANFVPEGDFPHVGPAETSALETMIGGPPRKIWTPPSGAALNAMLGLRASLRKSDVEPKVIWLPDEPTIRPTVSPKVASVRTMRSPLGEIRDRIAAQIGNRIPEHVAATAAGQSVVAAAARKELAAALPMSVSLPLPPIAFSIIVPRAMTTLPTTEPTLEKASELRLISWLVAKPE